MLCKHSVFPYFVFIRVYYMYIEIELLITFIKGKEK